MVCNSRCRKQLQIKYEDQQYKEKIIMRKIANRSKSFSIPIIIISKNEKETSGREK
jgi:hypothetical protein